MTLIELMVAFSILFLCVLGFLKVIAFSATTTGSQREASMANEAARQMIEVLQAEDFATVFARYNSNAADDPGGAGTAPGSGIDVPELTLSAGNTVVGQIVFPAVAGDLGELQLREDIVDPTLGMPSAVRIRFEWEGQGGTSSFEIKTLLADY